MATINEFLDIQKKAKNSVETAKRKIRAAYDAAQASTRGPDDTYDRLDLLTNEDARTAFSQKLTDELTLPILNSIQELPEDEVFAQALAMNGFYGFTPDQTTAYVSAAKDKTSFEGLFGFLEEQTGYKKALETRLSVPTTTLDSVAVQDVLGHVGLVCDTDARDQVTLQEKIELLDVYDRFGVVPPKYLEKKQHLRPEPGRIARV